MSRAWYGVAVVGVVLVLVSVLSESNALFLAGLVVLAAFWARAIFLWWF